MHPYACDKKHDFTMQQYNYVIGTRVRHVYVGLLRPQF